MPPSNQDRDVIAAGHRKERSVPFRFAATMATEDELHKQIAGHARWIVDDYTALIGVPVKGARKARILAQLERMRILAEALPEDVRIDSMANARSICGPKTAAEGMKTPRK